MEKTGGLKQQKFIILQSWGLKDENQGESRTSLAPKPLQEEPSLLFPASGSPNYFLTCGSITQIFASIFTWPSSLCVHQSFSTEQQEQVFKKLEQITSLPWIQSPDDFSLYLEKKRLLVIMGKTFYNLASSPTSAHSLPRGAPAKLVLLLFLTHFISASEPWPRYPPAYLALAWGWLLLVFLSQL